MDKMIDNKKERIRRPGTRRLVQLYAALLYNANLNITAPPNSPWAAINDNFGLEMMGHMTRICELPNERFPFRYYLHDPWWINSPWYDRYNGTPCDIYMPMSIGRIDGEGKVCSANTLNILSIDTSFGEMPEQCTNEVIPHLLKAKKDEPTEPREPTR